MSDRGVTLDGFVLKPLSEILADKFQRAKEMFGEDIDLGPTSVLRKILDIASIADLELWKAAESLYYSGFIDTASGAALDLLGSELGIERRRNFRRLTGTLKATSPQTIPAGETIIVGPADSERRFRTLAEVAVSATSTTTIQLEELVRNGAAVADNTPRRWKRPELQTIVIETIKETPWVKFETDASYRRLLIDRPRTIWTLEAVKSAVAAVDGVRDCRLLDPYGGIDVSMSRFKIFKFGERPFGTVRPVGEPYRFQVWVACADGYVFEEDVKPKVEQAIAEVRPIAVLADVRQANDVRVGLRARVVVRRGQSFEAVRDEIERRVETRVGALGFGGTVRYSDMMCDCREVEGVVDVRYLRLRRHPVRFGTVRFGASPRFLSAPIEREIGDNLSIGPDEIAKFEPALVDLEEDRG